MTLVATGTLLIGITRHAQAEGRRASIRAATRAAGLSKIHLDLAG